MAPNRLSFAASRAFILSISVSSDNCSDRFSAYDSSFRAIPSTKSFCRCSRMNACTPSTPVPCTPPGKLAEASIGRPARSFARASPVGPKPSNESPNESNRAWHPAHTGFARCAASTSRNGLSVFDSSCGNSGTTGGGGGITSPSNLCTTQ